MTPHIQSAQVDEPLLERIDENETPCVDMEEEADAELSQHNDYDCVINLVKGLLGAGIMTLPRACAIFGSLMGGLLLSAVGLFTWIGISRGMVWPAAAVSTSHGILDYSGLVRRYLGNGSVKVFNTFLIANALGFAVMYCDISADVLLGSEGRPGVIPEALLLLKVPDYVIQWAVFRPLFLFAFIFIFVLPLSLKRDMAALGPLNAIGLGSLAAFGATLITLALAAVYQGQAYPLPLFPDLTQLDSLGASSRVFAFMSILPVLLTADGCQQSIMPLAGMMRPSFTRARMDKVTAVGLAFTSAFYALIASASYVAFGPEIQDDILTNMTAQGMKDLVGPTAAFFLAYTVRIAFVVSLLGSLAINNFPLRDAIIDVAIGEGEGKMEAKAHYFVPLTVAVLSLVYLASVLVPSIWIVVGFVGSVAGSGVCFIFPALLMHVYIASLSPSSKNYQSGGVVMNGVQRNFHQAVALVLLVSGLGILLNGTLPSILSLF